MEAPDSSSTLATALPRPRQETLAVIVEHAGKAGPELGVAAQGPGRAAREYIDIARLQRLETVVGGQRPVLHRVLGAEHGGSERGAELNVEPGAALVPR